MEPRGRGMDLILRTNQTYTKRMVDRIDGMIADNFHQVIVELEPIMDHNNNQEYHILIYDLGLDMHNLTAATFINFINDVVNNN